MEKAQSDPRENQSVKGVVACEYGHADSIGKMNLTCCAGDFITVTGAGGSGKTALVKTIAGELSPVCGQVLVNSAGGSGKSSTFLSPCLPEDAGAVDADFIPDLTVKRACVVGMRGQFPQLQ